MAPNTENMTALTETKEEATKLKQHSLKGSVVLDLGNYNAAAIPLGILTLIFSLLLYSVKNGAPAHPLTKGLFLLDSLPFILTLVYLYILICTVWGPNLMKNREAIKMKTTIKYYNIFQVIVCTYMFYEFGVSAWFGKYNYFCEKMKYTTEPSDARIASVVYIYYLTKVLDLLDTVFFVLNKKWENISLLHLVHHSTMVLNLWFACLYMPNGQITFSMFLNSFIHIVMYGYYFLASLGPAVRPYLWWKKYLTVLQIVQLTTILIHASQVYFNDCHVNVGLMSVSVICAVIYIALFLDFYINSYHQKTSNSKSKIEVNGSQKDLSTHLKQR